MCHYRPHTAASRLTMAFHNASEMQHQQEGQLFNSMRCTRPRVTVQRTLLVTAFDTSQRTGNSTVGSHRDNGTTCETPYIVKANVEP